MRTRLFWLIPFCFLLVQPGCTTWDTPSESQVLPTPRLAPGGVVLEVEFVRIPPAQADAFIAMWSEVDEQQISLDARRRLDANGLRSGIVGLQLPIFLRNLLDSEKPAYEQLADGNLVADTEIFSNYQRLQCRSGSRKRVVASPQRPGRSVIILNREGQLGGEPYDEAQAVFTVATYPQGDGSVRLVVTPVIEHGQTQMKYVALPGSMAMQTGREETEFDEMRIDTTLSPGQTLIVAGAMDARGLGGFVFSDSVGSSERSLMLIRLAQSRYDDLWSEDRTLTQLTTPIE